MGKYRREVREQEAQAAKLEKKKLAIGAAAVLAVGGGIVGFAMVQNHNDLYGAYCKVGNHEVSKLEYEFFYNSTVNNFLTTYGSYLSYIGLDTSKSFSEQQYQEGMTWEEYFQSQALELMKEVYILSDAAKEAQFGMKQETYDDFYANVETYSKEYKLSVDEYLKEMYGPHATKKNIDGILQNYFLASDYASHLQTEALIPSDEEILAHYEEHKDDYDKVDYRMFTISADPAGEIEVEADTESTEKVEYTDEQWKAAMDKAKVKAEEFFEQVYDEETFQELCVKYAKDDVSKKEYEDNDASLFEGVTKSGMNSAVAEWLMDDAREKDATAIIEDSDNHVYYVVYFLNRTRDDSATINVRHALIAPEAVDKVAEGASDEEIAAYEQKVADADTAAKTKADELLAQWKENNPTEDSFAAMANENSADSPEGGLYEGVVRGEMVPEFDAWIFDEARKEGDTGIVKTTYGYHIMYFVSTADPAWKNSIRDTLISKAYNDFIVERAESYKFEDIKGKLAHLVETTTESVESETHDHEHETEASNTEVTDSTATDSKETTEATEENTSVSE